MCTCCAAEAAAAPAPPAGREIPIQTSGKPELSEEATPTAPGKDEVSAKVESKEGAMIAEEGDMDSKKVEMPKEDPKEYAWSQSAD